MLRAAGRHPPVVEGRGDRRRRAGAAGRQAARRAGDRRRRARRPAGASLAVVRYRLRGGVCGVGRGGAAWRLT